MAYSKCMESAHPIPRWLWILLAILMARPIVHALAALPLGMLLALVGIGVAAWRYRAAITALARSCIAHLRPLYCWLRDALMRVLVLALVGVPIALMIGQWGVLITGALLYAIVLVGIAEG